MSGPTSSWSPSDSEEIYRVEQWGHGYFSIASTGSSRGNVLVHPGGRRDRQIDLKQLVDQLHLRGIDLPVLLRFGGILQHRIVEIERSFRNAIQSHGYGGGYYAVYPIKVNQQRQVVEEILEFGRPFGFGLEVGSKAELLAVLAVVENDTPIICNGFKDDEYIEMVVLAQKVGRRILVVVERLPELDLLLEYAERHGTRPRLGVRMKIATPGAGRWKDSAGYRSKFGLSVIECLTAIERLKSLGLEDCLELLHFHMGSQITNIRQIKAAVTEAARVYVQLKQLGAGLKELDVGGGLGVDYDGTQTDVVSSVNYSLQEYANDVVFHVRNVCDDAGVEHPAIVTECGRAISAHHGVLIFNVLGTSAHGRLAQPDEGLSEPTSQPLSDLLEVQESLTERNLVESFHDVQQALDEAISLFRLGYMSLEERAMAENLFWKICSRIRSLAGSREDSPAELGELEDLLAETYYCNVSVFQSLPDSWAIDQVFPVMPIHRHDEMPAVDAVLGDISCDSDGKIDRFIDLRGVRRTLPVHPLRDEPYYLAVFLVGAYQEILGDLHNLLGDTNAVHVDYDEETGTAVLDEVVKGDTVREVLQYVQFDAEQLATRFRRDVEAAVRAGRLEAAESGRLLRFYEAGLDGYTYLEDPVA